MVLGTLTDSHSSQSSRIRQAVLVRNPSIDYPPRSAARRSKWLVGQEVAGPATFRYAAWGKDTAQLWGQLHRMMRSYLNQTQRLDISRFESH